MTDTEVDWNTVRHDCGCESYNGAGMLSWRWRPKSRCPTHERLDASIAAQDWPEVDRLLAVLRGG